MAGVSIFAQRAYQQLLMENRDRLTAGLVTQNIPWEIPYVYTSLFSMPMVDPFVCVVSPSEQLVGAGTNIVGGTVHTGLYPLSIYVSAMARRQTYDLDTFEQTITCLSILAGRIQLLLRETPFVEFLGTRYGVADSQLITATDESQFIPESDGDPGGIILGQNMSFSVETSALDLSILWEPTILTQFLT